MQIDTLLSKSLSQRIINFIIMNDKRPNCGWLNCSEFSLCGLKY
jgi:hypothetical protein